MDSTDTSAFNYPIGYGLDSNQFPTSHPNDDMPIPLAAYELTDYGFGSLAADTIASNFTASTYAPSDDASVLSPYYLSNEMGSGEMTKPPRQRPRRFNQRTSTLARTKGRKNSVDDDEGDGDNDYPTSQIATSVKSHREIIRKQRIDAMDSRRRQLKQSYARLKEALPPPTNATYKIALLDRAAFRLKELESRLEATEAEVIRLRSVNEALVLGAGSRLVDADEIPVEVS